MNLSGRVTFYDSLPKVALELIKQPVDYDLSYVKIPYFDGDVSQNKGVYTDVVFVRIGN